MTRMIVSVLLLLLCKGAFAQEGDKCEVYLLDVEAARSAFDEYVKTNDKQKLKDAPNPEKMLGSFSTEVGEDKITARHFPIPDNKQIVTAGVLYTESSMTLQKKGSKTPTYGSIILVIAVSEAEEENPYEVANNAFAETTYTEDTLGANVGKRIVIKGRPFEVHMDCQCNGSTLPEDAPQSKQ